LTAYSIRGIFDRWYETSIADRLYGAHLDQLRKEGLIDG